MKQVFLIMIGLSVFLWAAAAERFTRDAAGIVTDSQTNLQWQDDYSDNSSTIKTAIWTDAIGYCEALDLDGTDWRLPNKKELLSIVDYAADAPSISSVFDNTASLNFWSSTTYAIYTDRAWIVNFGNGYSGTYDKATNSYNVRCVRAGL